MWGKGTIYEKQLQIKDIASMLFDRPSSIMIVISLNGSFLSFHFVENDLVEFQSQIHSAHLNVAVSNNFEPITIENLQIDDMSFDIFESFSRIPDLLTSIFSTRSRVRERPRSFECIPTCPWAMESALPPHHRQTEKLSAEDLQLLLNEDGSMKDWNSTKNLIFLKVATNICHNFNEIMYVGLQT